MEYADGEDPRFDTVYPEYLTDVNLYRCPSTAGNDTTEQKNSAGVDITVRYCDSASSVALGVDEESGLAGVVVLTGQSYEYHPLIYDKCDDTDPMFTGWGANIAQQMAAAWISDPCEEVSMAEIPGCYDQDLQLTDGALSEVGAVGPIGNGGGDTIYRLKEGIERFMISDINNPAGSAVSQSEISVYFDYTLGYVQAFNHVPGGANVLYMDGHVEFVRYPGKWPVTRWWATLLSPGGLFD
jgi:prepilin-type processing-associated H-X9-DG protein